MLRRLATFSPHTTGATQDPHRHLFQPGFTQEVFTSSFLHSHFSRTAPWLQLQSTPPPPSSLMQTPLLKGGENETGAARSPRPGPRGYLQSKARALRLSFRTYLMRKTQTEAGKNLEEGKTPTKECPKDMATHQQ